MKRLSSFGFVPLSSDSKEGQDKRPKISQLESKSSTPKSSNSQATEASGVQQQPSDQGIQPPVVRISNDIGSYSPEQLKTLCDKDKLWVLRNPYRPDCKYKFPHKVEYGKNRSFQFSWLSQFPWLCYSESRDGGFCVNCALFARHSLPLGQLVSTPMTNFTRAKATLQEHSNQSTHKVASLAVVDFINYMEKGVPSIEQQIESQTCANVRKTEPKCCLS